MEAEKAEEPRARFYKMFNELPGKIDLVLGISPENIKQRGANLKAFVALINSHKDRFEHIEVMLTGHLHRHYVTHDKAREYDDEFVKEATPLLDKLEVSWSFVYWRFFSDTEEFLLTRKQLNSLIETDNELRVKLKNVVAEHTKKGREETQVKEYLCEEATWFLFKKPEEGKKVYLTYPASKLNAVCTHLMEKYSPEVEIGFLPYTVVIPSPKKGSKRSKSPGLFQEVTPEAVIASCAQTSLLLGQFGIHSDSEKVQFFAKFLEKNSQVVKETQSPTSSPSQESDRSDLEGSKGSMSRLGSMEFSF